MYTKDESFKRRSSSTADDNSTRTGQWNETEAKHSSSAQRYLRMLSVRQYNHSFKIRESFSLPVPAATLPIQELLSTVWMKELKDFLTKLPAGSHEPIALLTADYTYRAVLVNWLITATVVVQPPVENILVISLNKSLHETLKARRIPCIYVDPTSILNPSFDLPTRRSLVKSQIMVTRMTVMRFINHWGFDFVLYDIDALIIRNPSTLYQQYSSADIIGSRGTYPLKVERVTGVSLCTGVLLIRSSPQTGK